MGDFVACVYDSHWYLGKVKQKDEVHYFVDFMMRQNAYSTLFDWPRPKDLLWLRVEDILGQTCPPEASSHGTTRTMENGKLLPEHVVAAIEKKFYAM